MEIAFRIILIVLVAVNIALLFIPINLPKLGPEYDEFINFPETYHELLNRGLQDLENNRLFMFSVQGCKLSDSDLAVQIKTSIPTVKRWRSGETSPHPSIKDDIYTWLLKNTQDYNLSDLIDSKENK